MFNRKIILDLKDWKNRKPHKPLIIRGARQVGKTSIVRKFAADYFDDLIEINLDREENKTIFNKELSVGDFEKIIQIRFNKRIEPGKTLIFLDEIQNAPYLIQLLRYLYEDHPEWHIVATGSLLEVKMQEKGFQFPVGRVSFLYMYPVDFFEYLEITGKNKLLQFLNTVSLNDKIPDGIHVQGLKDFYEYVLIGGMPEIIQQHQEKKDFTSLRRLYSALWETFREDIIKYSGQTVSKYASFILENIPRHAGSLYQYQKFGGGGYRSRELKETFDLLEKSMMLYQIRGTKSIDLPITGQIKKPKKLIFLDVGLLNHLMGIQSELVQISDLNELYRGRISEQVTAQQLIAQYSDHQHHLFYWSRDKAEGDAEVDFCYDFEGKYTGVEVKSGKSANMKSLISFAEKVTQPVLFRVYGGKILKETLNVNGKKEILLSIPFYLLPRINEFIF